MLHNILSTVFIAYFISRASVPVTTVQNKAVMKMIDNQRKWFSLILTQHMQFILILSAYTDFIYSASSTWLGKLTP